MGKNATEVSVAVITEIQKLNAQTPTVVMTGDVKAVKRQRRLIALAVKNALALKTNFDKSVKTAQEGFAGEDFLAGVELFRTVKPDAAKPGRKATRKPTDEEMFEMILAGELDEEENDDEG